MLSQANVYLFLSLSLFILMKGADILKSVHTISPRKVLNAQFVHCTLTFAVNDIHRTHNGIRIGLISLFSIVGKIIALIFSLSKKKNAYPNYK